jgi:hypothetical protein
MNKTWREQNRDLVAAQNKRRRERILGAEKQVPETKYCPKCQLTLAAGYFGKDKGQRDGLTTICGACRRVSRRRNQGHVVCLRQVPYYEAAGQLGELEKRLAASLETWKLGFEDRDTWTLVRVNPKAPDSLVNSTAIPCSHI